MGGLGIVIYYFVSALFVSFAMIVCIHCIVCMIAISAVASSKDQDLPPEIAVEPSRCTSKRGAGCAGERWNVAL